MVWLKRSLGVNPDNRTGISSALRNTGYPAQQIPFREFNELFFKSQIEHAWGTQGQVLANEATFYTDASGVPKDKNGATVTLLNDSRIVMVHNVPATGNIVFNPVSGKRFLIQSEIGTDVSMGDAGGGIPHKLIFGSNVDGCDVMLNTTNRFEDIPFSASDGEKRFVANQGIRNKIQVNETICYDPANCGSIVMKDSFPVNNPYLIRMDGRQENWATDASNSTIAWMRDLNKYLGGYRDGSETQSRFTLPAVISASPYKFQVNTANSIMRDISTVDPDIHSRSDANGVSISATADFDGSSTVTFQGSIGNVKNFMRITGGSVPGGSSATTILVDIDATARTATMIDWLTFAPVTVGSATGVSVTMDNSGASGGSLQVDSFQGHQFEIGGLAKVALGSASTNFFAAGDPAAGSVSVPVGSYLAAAFATLAPYGAPRLASVTRDNTTDIYTFYQA